MLTELLLKRPSLTALQQVQDVVRGAQGYSRQSTSKTTTSEFGPDYRLSISEDARKLAAAALAQSNAERQQQKEAASLQNPRDASMAGKESESSQAATPEETDKGPTELTKAEQKQVEDMKKRDKEVRAHEQAHLSAAGGYARGGINLQFATGPDNKRYAVSGHVNLDTGKEKTPEATLRKAAIIRKAALAPANPSSTDRQVAAQATQMALEARREIQQQSQQEIKDSAQSEHSPVVTSA